MAYSGFIKLLTAAAGVRWIYQLRGERWKQMKGARARGKHEEGDWAD